MRPSSSGRAGSIGVVAALAAEARQLGPAVRRDEPFARLADGTRLIVTGVGCDAAAQGARELVAAGCEALASWGLAGGLDPALQAGAVVVPREVLFEGRASLRPLGSWRDRILRALEPAGRPVATGVLLTSRVALATVSEKSSAFRGTGAAAVDMESFAVGEVALARGLPFLAVRAIVDTAADEVPAALASATDARGRVSVARIVVRLAAEPSGIGALLGLAARYRAAARALRAVAATRALTAHHA